METLREERRRACEDAEAHEKRRQRLERERCDVSIARAQHPDPYLDVLLEDLDHRVAFQERVTRTASERCAALRRLLERIDPVKMR